MIKKDKVKFATFPANGKQAPAALTNNIQENVDLFLADNMIQRGKVRIDRKKYKSIFSKA
jgi:hypothetical protein